MTFTSEKELVDAYLTTIDRTAWTVYPETGDFDVLLSRKCDGFQVGIEAKLSLNMKVVLQAADLAVQPRAVMQPGPDCRAVLVPWQKKRREQTEFAALVKALHLVVVRVSAGEGRPWASCTLPREHSPAEPWPEHFPAQRIALPDYIPDVAAGVAAPTKLTDWKIKAIKIYVLLMARGYLVRKDFARFGISPSTWTQRGWIIASQTRGQWVLGSNIPNFEKQHPENFQQIKDDFAIWNSRDLEGVI